MKRLVVFGCSYAFGLGLEDCFTDASKPSNFAWPSYIAQAMGRRLVNKSMPASSNKRIWHTISKFTFRPDDIVIISWTHAHRSAIIKTPWNVKNLINDDNNDEVINAYYEHLYSRYDAFIMTRLFITDANRICKDKNIPVYNVFYNTDWGEYYKKKVNTVPVYMEIHLEDYPKALDNMHLGQEGNRAYAASFMEHIGIDHSLKDIQKPYTLFQRIKNRLCK